MLLACGSCIHGQHCVAERTGGIERDAPARINALPLRTLLQLLHSSRPDIRKMIRARRRDDGIPDYGAVGGDAVGGVGVRPLGGDVDEKLLGVPGEEGGEISIEGEADGGMLFLFGGVVVGAAHGSVRLHLSDTIRRKLWWERERGKRRRYAHLDVPGYDLSAGRPRRTEVRQRDEERNHEGGGSEQPEGVLHARERVVHCGSRPPGSIQSLED